MIIAKHWQGYAIRRDSRRAFVVVYSDASESIPQPSKAKAIALLPPHVRLAMR